MRREVHVLNSWSWFRLREFLQKSSYDAITTIFILARKGEMAFETPFGTGEIVK